MQRLDIIIFSFFILLTLFFTYPLIFKIKNSIFSDPEWTFDSLDSIYGIWRWKHAWVNKTPFYFNHLLSYPFGVDYSQHPRQPGITFPLLVLSLVGNEFFAYNIFILVSFILSAIIMYYLAYYLTKDKLASMVSGIIYAFCPNHSLQAFSHVALAVIQWMPLFILNLFILYERVSYKYVIYCAFSFALVSLTNYYYGYFMLIFTAGFILYITIGPKKWSRNSWLGKISKLKILKVIILLGMVTIVFILPFTYSAIKVAFTVERSQDMISAAYKRPYKDLFRYAARIYDYLLPSEYNPILGELTKEIVKKITGGQRHWAERTLYLGIVPLFLMVVSIIGWIKHWRLSKVNLRENFYIPFFIFSAALTFYFSLAPIINFGKIKIPTPSFLIYRLLPMFRVNARIGFVVTLCMAVLTGFGLKYILADIKGYRKKVIVSLTISLLILCEYTVAPPFRNVDLSKVPDVYNWLAALPDDIVIAEYPMVRSIEERYNKYVFYQRIHQKRTINGAHEGTIADAFRKKLVDITNPDVPPLLSYLGAKYVIIHKDIYQLSEMDKIDNMYGLSFVKDFSTARVYKIVAAPLRLIIVPINFGKIETWDDGSNWQWIDNNAQLWLCNNTAETIFINLQFKALSFAKNRVLKIFLDDNLLNDIMVPSVSSPDLAIWVSLPKIKLRPGKNSIRFYSTDGSQRVDDVTHTGDERYVSFAFSELDVERLPL